MINIEQILNADRLRMQSTRFYNEETFDSAASLMKETVSFLPEDKRARTRNGGAGILIFRPIGRAIVIITVCQCEDATMRFFLIAK